MKAINKIIIPEHLLNLLEIIHCDIPQQYMETFHATQEAITKIAAHVRVNKKYKILIGKSPFKILDTPNKNAFTFRLPKDLVCCVCDDYVFLDYLQLDRYDYHCKVAHILEEFAHALMNIKTHPFVREVVCYLYWPVCLDVYGDYQRRAEAPTKHFPPGLFQPCKEQTEDNLEKNDKKHNN